MQNLAELPTILSEEISMVSNLCQCSGEITPTVSALVGCLVAIYFFAVIR